MKAKNIVTWESIKNWLPVITMIVGIVLSFSAAQTRLALVEQSIVTIKQNQEEFKKGQDEIIALLRERDKVSLDDKNQLEARVGQLSLVVERLKAKVGF